MSFIAVFICAKYKPPLGGGREVTENPGLTGRFSNDDLKENNTSFAHLYERPSRSKKHGNLHSFKIR